MPPDLKVVSFPGSNVQDIPRGLRALADQIEAGQHGDALALTWVIDTGGDLTMGMLGKDQSSPGVLAHYLFCCAARKLEIIEVSR